MPESCPQCTIIMDDPVKCSSCGYSDNDNELLIKGLNGVVDNLENLKNLKLDLTDKKSLDAIIDRSMAFKSSVLKRMFP